MEVWFLILLCRRSNVHLNLQTVCRLTRSRNIHMKRTREFEFFFLFFFCFWRWRIWGEDFYLFLIGFFCYQVIFPPTWPCLVVKLTLLFHLDIDECSDQPGICQHGSCRNLAGTYICNCDSGYARSSDGKRCEGKNLVKDFILFRWTAFFGSTIYFALMR